MERRCGVFLARSDGQIHNSISVSQISQKSLEKTRLISRQLLGLCLVVDTRLLVRILLDIHIVGGSMVLHSIKIMAAETKPKPD